jgi:two-component system, chemotaxis family, sensor histidine kinase and response regulator WspE
VPRKEICVVVVGEGDKSYAVEVDSFTGQQRLVVRPLDQRLGKIPDVSAAAVLEDGRALLILDVEDLAHSIESQLSGGNLSRIRSAAEPVEERKSRHVLVVDDSLTVRELERKLLEQAGYVVDCAVDGMEGWNAVRLAQYDLVISDIDMPRMNGIELVRHIRQDARLKSLPIVIVSYKEREEDRMRGLEAGANYYLTKSSFHDASLIHAVVDLIGEARP